MVLPTHLGGRLDSKTAILSVLCKKWPLSAKEIYLGVKDSCGLNMSYQGVHKVVCQLRAEGILVEHDRKYALSDGWIEDLKKFADAIERGYLKTRKEPHIEIGSGSSVERNAFAAGREAAEKAARQIHVNKDYRLALVFASITYENDFGELVKGIKSITGGDPLVGCSPMSGEINNRSLNKSVVVVIFSGKKENFQAKILGIKVGDEYYKRRCEKVVSKIKAFKKQDKFDCGIVFLPGF